MREVISDLQLKKVIKESIDLICSAVSSTLGPTGNNVVISSDLTPFITNDGVTIAENIRSNDLKINTILEIIKEASFKTNELVGDGTTTTLVLLSKLYNLGVNSDINPIILKKELDNALEKTILELNKLKKIPTEKDLELIATTSCGDIELGKFLTEVYLKMKNKYAIKIEESKNNKTYYEIKKGYNIDIDLPNVYFEDKDFIDINSYILIINGYLDSLEEISSVINEVIIRNKNLIILVDDYNELVKNEIIAFYLENNKNIFIVKTPEYGSRKYDILSDISLITKSKIQSIDNINFSDINDANVIIKKDELIIISNSNVDREVNKLKYKLNTLDSYEKEFLENRISKLENGIATIYVGAQTTLEKREKIMRIEDAINALEVSKNGIVIGEGITYLKVSSKLNNKTKGEEIIKEVLKEPFKKIMENIGIDYKDILKEIINNNYEKCYNYKTLDYDKSVIDPILVLITALSNAVSIASMLLTTNYLVINENTNLKSDLL